MVEELDQNKEDIERQLVEKFIALDAEAKRLAVMADEKKKERETVEAELLDLLNDEGKKASARYDGIGHVTALDPVVGNAYILEGQENVLFAFLKTIDRADLIKTTVNHTSLGALINQLLKDGKEAPPGCGYLLRQKLRAFPERKKV